MNKLKTMVRHIVKEDGSYKSKFYTLNGKQYEVVGTKSVGYLSIQAIDTIKNIATGKLKEIERKRLYAYTRELNQIA